VADEMGRECGVVEDSLERRDVNGDDADCAHGWRGWR
jgi:hypothetical protein